MHPMFVALFIKTDADDLVTEEQGRRRHARQARRRGVASPSWRADC